MELFRIVAMAMIVMLHTNFFAIGEPDYHLCDNDPMRAYIQYLAESISIVGVNCFVFISGWFSINATVKGFANLIFQLLFYSIIIYLAFLLCGLHQFGLRDCLIHLNIFKFWFVREYIILYLLSPILNYFIKFASQDLAKRIVAFFVIVDVVLGWGLHYSGFNAGYSSMHLSVIYLIARYIRTYGGRIFSYNKTCDLSIYLLISILTPICILFSFYFFPSFWRHSGKLFLYNSPFVIVSTVCLGLFFSKLKFKSSVVNKVAASCFAVFLIHGDSLICDNYMLPFCREMVSKNGIMFYSLIMVVFIVCLFILAFLMDQVRLWCWRRIQRRFFID